ncbi:MAG TPA: GNAT family N-acetyltransferase [Ruminococcaceae bacterium]|nr:GNAT family N-acetyltransferase [Oscillospiraceae bacterium]
MYNSKMTRFFDDWEKAMIWSCLQGYMGKLIVDNTDEPKSAMVDVGDICFLAGEPNASLLNSFGRSKLLVPKDAQWEKLIESFFGKRAKKFQRYAIKKEPDIFDSQKLTSYVDGLDTCYEIRLFDQELFELAKSEAWSVDLCSQFKDYTEYQKLAVGVGILHQGKLVAGASPYAVYNGGIEIEIDTKPEYRRKGLATVCGAKLILECLSRNIYPSWDAHDKRSVALAEKLGYHVSHPYTAYELE